MSGKRNDDQISILDEFDRRESTKKQMHDMAIREKLRLNYVDPSELYGHKEEDIPSGIVMIVRSRYHDGKYFRVVTGYHKTVSGPALHLVSSPNAEWPDVPPWQPDKRRNGIQWVYTSDFVLYVKPEPETADPVWMEV